MWTSSGIVVEEDGKSHFFGTLSLSPPSLLLTGAARYHFHRFLLARHLPSSAVPLPLPLSGPLSLPHFASLLCYVCCVSMAVSVLVLKPLLCPSLLVSHHLIAYQSIVIKLTCTAHANYSDSEYFTFTFPPVPVTLAGTTKLTFKSLGRLVPPKPST